jgi:DNA-binding NarL/FixJ family response regulator
MAIRLLVVDDHPVVRAGVVGMFVGQPDFLIVGEATRGEDALSQAAALSPDVILLDLRMPGLGGLDVLRRLHPNPRQISPPYVLILTSYDTPEEIDQAIRAGARGYLLKDSPREVLYQAVRWVAQGQAIFGVSGTLTNAPPPESQLLTPLSEREIEVLSKASTGNTNKAIAHDLNISEATVKTHLRHIFEKWNVSDRAAAVALAVKHGII